MKTPTGRRSISRLNYPTLIAILILGVAALAVPLHSVSSGSVVVPRKISNEAKKSYATAKTSLFGRWGNVGSWGSVALALPTPTPETIATYASDCTTPKTTFLLGETVCAKTDGVDLNYPEPGRWVDWILTGTTNTIVSGSRTTTRITTNPQTFTYTPTSTGVYKVEITQDLNGQDDPQTPAVFTVSLGPDSIATFESTCNVAQDNFTLVMGAVTVCAKADASFSGNRYIYWVDDQGRALQTDVITSTSPSATRSMTAAGNYWVYFSDSDGSLRSKHAFTVSDPGQPVVDVAVSKNLITTTDIVAGGFITFEIVVTNRGPDTASTVELTDAVPAHVTYVSSTKDSGPPFTKTADTPTTTWSIASLPADSTASFTFTYQVDSGAAVGTQITNTANVSSTTTDSHPADNTSTGTGSVVSGAPANECNLDCPNDIVTTATTHGQGGGANVTFATAEGFGTCGAITSNPASGSFFPTGTTTVVVTSETGGGGCNFTVTVIDSAAPTISCPPNIMTQANSGQAFAYVPDPNANSSSVGTATATGTNVLVTGSREDGDALTGAYPIGVTKITWTATEYDQDPQNPNAQPTGRSASCQQTITVTSTDTPTITCPSNKTFNATNGCEYTATASEIGTPTTTGAPSSQGEPCPLSNPCAVRNDGLTLSDPFPAGQTTITWTATNSVGSASCTQIITVIGNDTTPPTLHVPPNIITSTDQCSVLLDEEQFVATAEDDGACGSSVTITRTGIPRVPCPVPGDPNRTCESFVFPTGTTIVTYTATDSSGNSTSGTQTVRVNEDPNIIPTIDAPVNLTVNTGPGATSCGIFVGDATLGTATASDNCPGFVVTRTGVPAGNNFPVGNTTVTYTVTDRVGNTAQDTQTVTVIDNTLPIVTPPGPVTLNTGPGATSCGVTVSNLDATLGTGSATDNCPGVGAVSRSGVPSGNFFPVGQTTLTYSATDAHGNTGTAQQVVTVVDNTAPVISCPANIVLEPTCPSGAKATFANATATDNCGVQSVVRTAGGASGTVFPIGTTTVTFTATDIYNNQSSCSFTVTVKTPQATIQDMINRVQALINQGALSNANGQSLINRLQSALDYLNAGKTDKACDKMAEFIQKTQNFIDTGSLTSDQGQPLINSANKIRNTLGCNNTSGVCT
jgi:uncharacterized repeat protein (TIGR01451 family)